MIVDWPLGGFCCCRVGNFGEFLARRFVGGNWVAGGELEGSDRLVTKIN